MKVYMIILLLGFSTSSAIAQMECLKGDCATTHSTCVFPSGSRYVGDFKDGKIHGRGILYFSNGDKYIGHWENHYREGEGRMIYASGDEYFGQFQKSRIAGYGEMSFQNGNYYEGEWEEDKPNGNGNFYFSNGDRYQGNFLNGLFSGKGTMYYLDGSRYVGEWNKNRRHGKGLLIFADGEEITGEWSDDQYLTDWASFAYNGDTTNLCNCNLNPCDQEYGRYIYKNGSIYVGEFINGEPYGKGTVYYPNKDRYEGSWKYHAPNGKGVMYYASGRVVGGIWEHGKSSKRLYVENGDPEQMEITIDQSPEIKIWAVVVGASRYKHMPTLRYTDDDAYQLYAFLKSPEGGALRDEQLTLLIDEEATRDNILFAMRNIFLQADENDVVLFYFSGHGLEGSFLPVDYDGDNYTLKHEELKNLLKASKAKHKLVLADACHSGSLLATRSVVNNTLNKYYKAFEETKGGTALMMSSKGEEYSLEDGGLRSGVFSHFLIKGLKGEADMDNDEIITILELFNFVYDNVRLYTGNVQTPTLTGTYDRNMPVAVLRR